MLFRLSGGLVFAAVIGAALTLTGRSWAAVNGITEGFETSDSDSYDITDNNPFDDLAPRGAPPGDNPEGATQGSGTWSLLNWTDTRHVTHASRDGMAEEVNQGFQGTPVLPSGHTRMLAIFPRVGGGGNSGVFDASTRHGGEDTVRKLDVAGPYSSSFDIYLNPNWKHDGIGGGGNGQPLIWYDPQVGQGNGTYFTEGTGYIMRPDADTWTVTGSGGSFAFDDADGGWYKMEVVVSVAPDGADGNSDTDLMFTTKLWSADMTQLIGSVTGQDYLSSNAALAYGNRSENFVFTGNSVSTAADTNGNWNNFFVIDNFREGGPLWLNAIPEPMTGLTLFAAGMLVIRRQRRN